ncbi:flagellar basal body M-ring protein FliF [[Limnothrix rosea] IAM M-220]|uniref:flagellar basal body M-ring protein FliF n=1 Tax=[Limnothrix rosea] IAM M-220 TaxID=454133 RepID=UPI000968B0D6|nr:flagellar basal body M-ring protein FliF [[Limnothrix rosea] IAM M-220]OKH17958.1 hypothetical protein NIES208_07240 [[Limnothrix rosea] IAM M-220]
MQFLKTKKGKIVAGMTAIAIVLTGVFLWSTTRPSGTSVEVENTTEELSDDLEALKEEQRRREAQRQD